MKKFLSLVLALVMTMSLVTISAGAKDFDDNGDIDYKEAVDVISALGIVDGYSDGSFRPDGSLTRGAAAKIICNLILGPTTASALSATTAPFKDVPTTNVFAGFITYCAQQGIISGYADGTFRPTGTLTGNAFMKMLLGALGYDSSIEGYTGSNWQVNVTKQAIGIGLKDGNDEFVGSKAVTRQEAALYALNMLKATMVEYDTKSTVVVGDVQISTSSTRTDVSNENGRTDGNIKDDDKMQFAEKYFTNLKLDGTGADDFGRPANVWTYKSDEVGTYAKTNDLVATFTAKVTSADVYDAVGKSVYDSLDDGKSDLVSYIDGVKTEVKASDVENYVEKNNTTKVNESGNGMLTEVYLDDDNNVTIVSINTYVFQAVSDYSSSKDSVSLTTAGDTNITLSDNTLDGDDFDIEDIKADDYILVTAVKDGSRYDVKTIAVAEVVTGTVNSYKSEDSVTIGDTTYKYSLTALDESDDSGVKNTMYTVGQEAAVVLDSYGYIIAVDAAVVSNNYVYISEFAQPSGLSSGKVVASAFFTDGTSDDITIKELLGSSSKDKMIPSGDKTANAGWYTYSVNSSDEYSLYKVESKYFQNKTDDAAADWGLTGSFNYNSATGAENAVTINDKVKFLAQSNGELNSSDLKANDKTIVIVNNKADDDVTVYTGVSNLPDIELAGANATAKLTVLANSSDYAYYVYIETTGNVSISGGEDTKLVYFVEYDGQHRGTDNEIYYTYTTLDGTSEKDVAADSQIGLLGTSDIYKAFYKSRVNGDEQLTSVKAVPDYKTTAEKFFGGSGSVITYKDGALTLGTEDYTLADNYTITLVTVGKDVDGDDVTAAALNKDKSADYEVSTVTAKELADTLKGYTNVSYNFEGKTTDNGGSVIEELYVTVTEAVDSNIQNAEKPANLKVTGKTEYTIGEEVTALTASATVSDGGTVTYEWYTVDPTTPGAKPVATGATYTPSITTDAADRVDLWVVATNTNRDVDGNRTATATEKVTITVGEAKMTITIDVTVNGSTVNGYKTEQFAAPDSGSFVTVNAPEISGQKPDTASKQVLYVSGGSATVTFVYTELKHSATITASDMSMKADGSDASSATQTVSINNLGKLTGASVTNCTDTVDTNVAALTDLVVTLDTDSGELTIAKADSATLDATDSYEITITGLAEDGVTQVTKVITVTITA